MTDIQGEKYSISRPLKPLINTWFSKDDAKVLLFIGKHVPCDDDLSVNMPGGLSTDFRT